MDRNNIRLNGDISIGEIKKTINFNFEWKIPLEKISPNVYEVAKLLNKKHLVEVEPNLNNDGEIVIRANSVCNKNFLVDNLLEESMDKKNMQIYCIKPDIFYFKCRRRNDDICKFDICPIFVAGYLYYLDNKGLVSEQLDVSNDLFAKFNKDEQEVLKPLKYKYKKNLFCQLEIAAGINKFQKIVDIGELLFKLGKINNAKPILTSFSQFSNKCEIPYNRLLVLTDLNISYGSANVGIADIESKKINKEIFAVERLEFLTYNQYIILMDEKEALDRFMSLSEKVKYYFREKISIGDLSNDEIKRRLLDNIGNRQLIDTNDKKKALEASISQYLEESRKYLPFKNDDLVDYLSNYINNRDAFELPSLLQSPINLEDYFNNIIGMDNIKEKLIDLRNYLYFNKDLSIKEDMRLHMMFLGNPGTGKTTIARIIANILFDLGYIKTNKLVEVDKKDLVGAYLGQSGIKTSGVIKNALGGVLFIDEAYTLGSDDMYSREVVATLLKAMEDYHNNLVIIFAGYRKEMQNFINSNSGIESRIGYTFDFPDYSVDELMEIFKLKLKDKGEYEIEDAAVTQVEQLFIKNKKYSTFGNGRFVEKLLQDILVRHATNNANGKGDRFLIEAEDVIPPNNELQVDDWISEQFSTFIGMKDIKDKLVELYNYLQFNNVLLKENKIALPIMNLHMMFLGNPGTGKTTLARKVAEMLYSLGYLKENKCIEVGKQDIVGQYVGETAKKVSALIKSALGGVLFIDEAYSLCEVHNSGYGKEAMEVIVKSMEDYRDNLIIIFAGYEEEMQDFIKMNSGIMSRIGYTFNFKDYETDELYNIYELKMKELGFQLNDVEQSVKDSCNYFKSIENFGNGRFVDKLVQKTLLKHSSNYKNPIEITKEDIPTIAEMIKESVMDEDAMIFPSDITDENKKQVAYHESGHALAQYLLEDKIDIKEITIIPEGSGTLGYVLHKPNKKAMYSKEDYMNIIKRLLAGRAAEDIVYNTYFAGCSSDIEKATKYAYLMTSRLGMCNELVPIDLSNYKAGNALQDEIDNSVKEILNSCYKEIKALLEENKDLLYSLAKFMLSKNHITGEDFEEFLKKKDL